MTALKLRADQWLAAFAALALFFTRPSAFGEVYTLPGMLAVLAATAAIIVIAAATRRPSISGDSVQLWAYIGFALFLGSQVVFGIKPRSADIVAKQVVVVLIGSVLGFVLIAELERIRTFFDTLAGALILISTSTIVTFSLLLTGHPVAQLAVGTFHYEYVPPAGVILFPFSMIYNYAPTWFGPLPRLSGFFREVGIFPAFACWAASYASFRRWPLPAALVCLVASVISFSSLGALLAIMTSIGIFAGRMKLPWWAYVLAPAVVIFIVSVTYDLPYIGIGYKFRFVSDSYVERMNAIRAFGDTNLLVGGEADSRNAGINLISAISIYGLIGVATLLGTTLPALRKVQFFCAALAAPLVVALLSEPIAQEPFFVLLFLSWRVFASQNAREERRSPEAVRVEPVPAAMN